MKQIRALPRFARDLRRLKRELPRNTLDFEILEYVLEFLSEGKPLPEVFRDHALRGEWSGLRECHLDADWLLIYRVKPDAIVLHRTGTHQQMFKRAKR
ncbi:MAG: type II toxin-antitoxin system YafQ family toxin [Pseudomonadota bacterium]